MHTAKKVCNKTNCVLAAREKKREDYLTSWGCFPFSSTILAEPYTRGMENNISDIKIFCFYVHSAEASLPHYRSNPELYNTCWFSEVSYYGNANNNSLASRVKEST